MKEEFLKKIEKENSEIVNILKNQSKEYLINYTKNKSLSSIFNIVFKEIQISLIEKKNELSISLYRFLIILKLVQIMKFNYLIVTKISLKCLKIF